MGVSGDVSRKDTSKNIESILHQVLDSISIYLLIYPRDVNGFLKADLLAVMAQTTGKLRQDSEFNANLNFTVKKTKCKSGWHRANSRLVRATY